MIIRRSIQHEFVERSVWDRDIFLLEGHSYFCTMASSVPFIGNNGAVRSIFTCNQRKSAACGDSITVPYQYFGLSNPETPRICTLTESSLKICDGQNVIVAVMPWYGYNTEDAIVCCSQAIDNDLLAYSVEKHTLSGGINKEITISNDLKVGSVVRYGVA